MVSRGFTLIELLVALTIIALLLSLVVPQYTSSLARADDAALKEDLFFLRDAIDKFYMDKGHFPNALDELVTEKYLRAIPVDPFTKSSRSWLVVPAEDPGMGVVGNVRSGAPNAARDGTWLRSW